MTITGEDTRSEWKDKAGNTITELPAYERGVPITYYVVEESVKTKVSGGIITACAQDGNTWKFTNRPTLVSKTFTKAWLGADGGAKDWPVDGDGKAIPATIEVTRRLKGQTQMDDAFSLICRVGAASADCALLTVNGENATPTDKARYTIAVTKTAAGSYPITVSGLDNLGSMVIGGNEISGMWDYFVTEARVSGYATVGAAEGIDYDPDEHTATVVVTASGGKLIADEPQYDGINAALTVENRVTNLSFAFSKL